MITNTTVDGLITKLKVGRYGFEVIIDSEDLPIILKKGNLGVSKDEFDKPVLVQFGSPIISLGRYLLGLPTGDRRLVDHKNGNALDNRKENLRVATKQQNNANRGLLINNKSGYKGVSWRQLSKRWCAFISVNNKSKFLGSFKIKEEAARAYDKAAKEHYGEFAILNFPDK